MKICDKYIILSSLFLSLNLLGDVFYKFSAGGSRQQKVGLLDGFENLFFFFWRSMIILIILPGARRYKALVNTSRHQQTLIDTSRHQQTDSDLDSNRNSCDILKFSSKNVGFCLLKNWTSLNVCKNSLSFYLLFCTFYFFQF